MEHQGLKLNILWSMHNIYILITFFICPTFLNSGFSATAAHFGLGRNETDQLSLLAIKASIVDPLQAMRSWNESIHFCEWQGVTCDRGHRRVIKLNLQSKKLGGFISPYVGNLSFLNELQLQNNSFGQGIPPELGQLSQLQNLSLNNNSFTGRIPANLSSCSNLISLDISYNSLEGNIPTDLGSLSKIQVLIIHDNNLTGSISTLGNLSSLHKLSAAENNFVGSIPNAFGLFTNLEIIALGINKLSGTIPSSLFNRSSLTAVDVTGNQIEGSLPWDLGITLPKLQFLNIGNNHFTGSIPVSISNASNLHVLIMVQNQLTGKVPNLDKISELEWLSISDNHLGTGDSDDLSFLSTLLNATNLQVLAVNENNFGGILPESIGNLSSNLEVLYVDNNHIVGSIPTTIGNIVNLQSLYMQGNQLTGNIPAEIGKLQNLHELNLIANKLSGEIPGSLGNLSLLSELVLGRNNLQGSIPSSLGNCKNLQMLFLSQNNLSGTIPKEVMSLSSLSVYLDLSQNLLSGTLPTEVGSLINLGSLDVSENRLSGEIPGSLGSCLSMETLRLQGNFFQGTIPSSFRYLRGIKELDLSRNNLSGVIPDYLEGFNLLQNLNLSFNDFEGAVPREGKFTNTSAVSVMGNSKLCGGVPSLNLPECNLKGSTRRNKSKLALKLALSISCGLVGLALVVCYLYICLFRRTRKQNSSIVAENSTLKVSYQSLLKATDGFSLDNLIGLGSFGSVYKGVLDQHGTSIAVKVLNLLRQGASKSFVAECEALRNIRHRNLVKVLTACSGVDYKGNDFKALVYDYMSNGSLEEWLHPSSKKDLALEQPRKLNLLQRLNIAIGVACALDYLHHDCQTPVVHCDLKPSNILLDSEMTARVGDFGLARFLHEATHDFSKNPTSSVGVRGSIGYAAPEYGMGSDVSTCGDMYSFGILVLELLTAKRPTDDMFKDGFNLRNFVKAALPHRVVEIADPTLLVQEREEKRTSTSASHIQDCLILICKIGIACSAELPRERMSSGEAAAELQSIRGILTETAMEGVK